MTYWLSQPVEALLDSGAAKNQNLTIDTLIVGSGYGAAMAALALTESDNSQHGVVVFERGDEYLPHDFPRTLGELPGHVPADLGGKDLSGLWDVRVGTRAVSVAGNGLGGTSLVNASVAVQPDESTLATWPASGVDADWQSLFGACYPKIYQLLGVNQIDNPERFKKFNALKKTVDHIDEHATIHAAPVAINFNGGGKHSVDHEPCNHCGNCVIGCHSGAKQSLNLNAWPLAKQRGADLYTGVRVLHLSQVDDKWMVHCHASRNSNKLFQVTANRVILAAGSIGSTEILHRSANPGDDEDRSPLHLSDMLGKKFSANGDGLIFTSGEEHPVNAIADVPDNTATDVCGPTIIGFARTSEDTASEDTATENTTREALKNTGQLTIEDGAIPYPLMEVWRETLTMQSYLRRFVSDTRTKWHQDNPAHDDIATSHLFAKHSQVLLTMGFDNSPGQLVADNETGNLLPVWPERAPGEGYYAALDRLFKAKEPAAYAGGEYHPNPLLQPLPNDFNNVFEGVNQIEKRVVTVHPLGGSVMGDSAATGVVNNHGQVFRVEDSAATGLSTDSERVYDNLYIMDGSVLPTAVGVNPMITISALAYTLASRIAGHSVPLNKPFATLASENRAMPVKTLEPVGRDKSITARFNERLLWSVDSTEQPLKDKPALAKDLEVLFKDRLPDNVKTLVLDVTFFFDNAEISGRTYRNSLEHWLADPTQPLRATAVLKASDKKLLHGSADTFVPMPELMQFNGEVTLGSRDTPGAIAKVTRRFSAVWRFLTYRPSALGGLFKSNVSNDASMHDTMKGILRILKLHTEWRYLVYKLTEDTDTDNRLIITGQKTLAYTRKGNSVWDALLYLPAKFTRGDTVVDASLSVDLLRITHGPSPLQITSSPNEPASYAAVGGFAALLTRLIGTPHFWSFGAHNYHRFLKEPVFDKARRRTPPNTIDFIREGKRLSSLPAEIYRFEDPDKTVLDCGAEQEELLARLVRYREDSSTDQTAVLLVHGLSHSSEIFWPEHVDETYVQFLLKQGYDVWVFDHRTSGNTRYQVNEDHTWDDIALTDVPWAVNQVFNTINSELTSDNVADTSEQKSNPKLVHVFSHCIGAGAVAMAVLAGKLQQPSDKKKSMLGSLIPHAVTPWVFSSCENRTRANVWSFVKDVNFIKVVDPRMHSTPTLVDTVLDRIASSTINEKARIAWPWWENLRRGKSKDNEYAKAMYFRYTVFWGRQWVHRNMSDELIKRFPTMVGEVPANILQQTSYCVRRKRLVNKDANNIYVSNDNLISYWTFPTLFLHGESNQVFDVESSRLSAYRLARLRHDKAVIPHDWEFSTADYARHGVWLETTPDYGHMDMIIGKRAASVVGPLIDKFFKAAVAQNIDWQINPDAIHDYEVFESEYANNTIHQDDLPRTRTRASKFPFTGPVISSATKSRLRLWAEADDYDTETATGLSAESETNTDLQVTPIANNKPDDLLRGCFRSIQINRPEKLDGCLQVRVKHDSDVVEGDLAAVSCNVLNAATQNHTSSQDFGRMRDIDHDGGAELNLAGMPWFKRLYGADNSQSGGDISFIAGSCLHPGSAFSRDLSDSIFEQLWQQVVQADGPDFLLLLGDQIYADATAGIFDPKASYERYRVRYREAYGARGMRRVLSHLPTYFVVDDHAYKDNFSGLIDIKAARDFSIAKAEAYNFQTQLNNTKQFWSNFELYGQPFFCFDTRFERKPGIDRNERNSIIGKDQAGAFEEWLINNKDKRAIFLCSGSPLIPVKEAYVQHPSLSGGSDTLVAYPGFLEYLIEKLHAFSGKIFLLSGDPHLSCRGAVALSSGNREVTIENIVSSPLNAPFPFANARASDYLWGQSAEVPIPDSPVLMSFRQELLSTAAQQFCRMNYAADSGILRVTVYSPDGPESGASEISFS